MAAPTSTAGTATADDAELQAEARALGDPTRHALFRQIAEASEPVGIAELSARFSFHTNAIRQHVAKLVAAGLVREERASATGPGRPRHVYVVDPKVAGRWGTPSPYERLSRLLVEVLRTGDDARTVGRREAVDQAAAVGAHAAAPTADYDAALAALADAMDRQGFAPERRRTRQGDELVLHHCPFETAAIEDRATICGLHLGLAEGILDPAVATVTELVAVDPRQPRCRLKVAPAATEAAEHAEEPVLALQGRSGRRRRSETAPPTSATPVAEPGGSR